MLGFSQEGIVGVLEVPGDSQKASNLVTCHICHCVVIWSGNFSTSSWSIPCLEHPSWVQGIENAIGELVHQITIIRKLKQTHPFSCNDSVMNNTTNHWEFKSNIKGAYPIEL